MTHRTWHPVVFGDIALIPLSRGKWATVDITDLHLLTHDYSWNTRPGHTTFYAHSKKKGDPRRQLVQMHRLILDVPTNDPRQVDHIDHNGLNNRRSNLRIATHSQNGGNSRSRGGESRFKGVGREGDGWRARIGDGQAGRIYLGTFATEEDAARAYDAAALGIYGEFARLNFSEHPLP